MREHGIPTQDEIGRRRSAWLEIGFLLGFALCVVFVATWLPSLQHADLSQVGVVVAVVAVFAGVVSVPLVAIRLGK